MQVPKWPLALDAHRSHSSSPPPSFDTPTKLPSIHNFLFYLPFQGDLTLTPSPSLYT